MSSGPVIFKRGWEHGEPGGAGGTPIPRKFASEPVPFIDTHPLFNDPEANPFMDPYAGFPGTPTLLGYEPLDY